MVCYRISFLFNSRSHPPKKNVCVRMSVHVCATCNKAVAGCARRRCTHSLVSDQVVLDGGAAVVLLDPVDLETVSPVLELGLQLGSAGFPWTGGKAETEGRDQLR